MGAAASKPKSLRAASAALKKPIPLTKAPGATLTGGSSGSAPGPSTVAGPTESTGRPNNIVADGQDPQSGEDPAFAERLRQLGTVQFQDVKRQYARSNEMLSAVESRQRLERTQNQTIEDKYAPKSVLHAETITAILESRRDGESDEQISRDFNLTPFVLDKLGSRLSVPPPPEPKPAESAVKNRVSVFEDEDGPVLER